MKFNLGAIFLFLGLLVWNTPAFAGGIGYINYQKVQENFPFAQQAIKEVDAKGLELQQYMVDKEKQYKLLKP